MKSPIKLYMDSSDVPMLPVSIYMTAVYSNKLLPSAIRQSFSTHTDESILIYYWNCLKPLSEPTSTCSV